MEARDEESCLIYPVSWAEGVDHPVDISHVISRDHCTENLFLLTDATSDSFNNL